MNKLPWILLGVVITAIPAIAATVMFSDVSEDDWYYDAVQNLQELGIVEGYEDGTYQASNSVNRAEMAVLLDRLTDSIRNGCIYRESEHDLGLLEDPDDMLIFLNGDTVYEGDTEEYTCENGNIGGYTWDPE